MWGTLFDESDPNVGPEELLPGDGSAVLHRSAMVRAEADAAFSALHGGLEWQPRTLRVYGREVEQPRLTAWFGDPGMRYRYSGLDLAPQGWPKEILPLKALCEGLAGAGFNSVLCNLYRDGGDGVAWHSDDEPELGPEPTIVSLSLGVPRRFDLKHKRSGERVSVVLPPGSVLVMSGPSQACWSHQIAKTKKVSAPRINLTFRRIASR